MDCKPESWKGYDFNFQWQCFPFCKELVDYYKHHSLKEGFRSLDTTLQFPYKESENTVGQRGNRAGGNCEYLQIYVLFSVKYIKRALARRFFVVFFFTLSRFGSVRSFINMSSKFVFLLNFKISLLFIILLGMLMKSWIGSCLIFLDICMHVAKVLISICDNF